MNVLSPFINEVLSMYKISACLLHALMYQRDIKLHVFVFLLRVCLFIVTGLVLHMTHATPSIFTVCPGLWESMTLILSLKCVRITVCKATMYQFEIRTNASDYFDTMMHLVYFCIECAITSRSLNSGECVSVMTIPFGGHPMIAYVNGLSCVWDGCLTISFALYTSINRSRRPI